MRSIGMIAAPAVTQAANVLRRKLLLDSGFSLFFIRHSLTSPRAGGDFCYPRTNGAARKEPLSQSRDVTPNAVLRPLTTHWKQTIRRRSESRNFEESRQVGNVTSVGNARSLYRNNSAWPRSEETHFQKMQPIRTSEPGCRDNQLVLLSGKNPCVKCVSWGKARAEECLMLKAKRIGYPRTPC